MSYNIKSDNKLKDVIIKKSKSFKVDKDKTNKLKSIHNTRNMLRAIVFQGELSRLEELIELEIHFMNELEIITKELSVKTYDIVYIHFDNNTIQFLI